MKRNLGKSLKTGSQILIETLIEQGVTDIFGYPGGQVLSIYDELYNYRDKINHILTAHEQGASHAADGYSRATGKVGVVLATSGPGATNLVTGIATAMLDSVPLIAITGNVPTGLIGKDGFQEIDITGVTLPITKHNYFVQDVRELADTVREAFKIAISGRPGPVLIDIPKDVQIAVCEFTREGPVEPYESDLPCEREVDKAVALINDARRPYIYIGGGVVGKGLSDEIIAFAEKIDAYIGASLMGLTAVPTSHERFLGMQGMHGRYASSIANREADLIIGIGVRFSDRATGNVENYRKNAKIIQLDVDQSEINKNVAVDVGLIGDLATSLSKICEKCELKLHPNWAKAVKKFKNEGKSYYLEMDEKSPYSITPKRVFDVINKLKSDSDIIATDVGQHQMWTAQYADFATPRTLITSGGLGTMGFGMGAAIGANVATDRNVILITGDGSFGMNLNELATAVTYNIPIVIVIFNNGTLGMVRQWQTVFHEKRYSNTKLERRTDFVKLAEAFGANGARVETIELFESVFKTALDAKAPYVIDVMIDSDEVVLPMLPPGGTVEDIIMNCDQEDAE